MRERAAAKGRHLTLRKAIRRFAAVLIHLLTKTPCPLFPLIGDRVAPARARRADRSRSRHQNHRRRRQRSGPAACHCRSRRFRANDSATTPNGLFSALRRATHAVGFVLGLPINMDGTEGPRAQATRAFARNLAKLTELPIALVGRAALDGRGRTRADRSRCQPRQAQGGDRPARRRLHLAGRARPAGEHFPGATHHRVMRCRTGTFADAKSGKVPDQRRTAAALHRVRDTYVFHPSGSARCNSVSAVRASMSSAP